MLGMDLLGRLEISTRARDPQDPVVGARRETQPRDCILHQLLAFPIQFAKTTERARGHLGVAENAEGLETARLLCRAARMRSRMAADSSLLSSWANSWYFTAGTWMCRSIRSSKGPEMRERTLDQGRACNCIRAEDLRKNRKGADSHFGARREIEINLEEPYKRVPAAPLNKFGLPEKSQYRTGDVCALLGIGSDLLRWRFLKGKYSEVRKDGGGRVSLLRISKRFSLRLRISLNEEGCFRH